MLAIMTFHDIIVESYCQNHGQNLNFQGPQYPQIQGRISNYVLQDRKERSCLEGCWSSMAYNCQMVTDTTKLTQ